MSKRINTRAATVQAIDTNARRVSAVASTEEVDSFGTVLLASGWDLTRFIANPVLLFAHDGNTRTPVGHCENVRVEGTELLFDAVFDDSNAFDEEVYQKYLKKVMRGFSVRFEPAESRTEKRDGRDVYVYTRQILMEISCAPVPSNAGALARTATQRECGPVKRSQMMAALRMQAEGEGDEGEKKAAAVLYEKMGGAKGELAAREAEEGASPEETKAAEDGEQPPPESEKGEEQKTARAAVAVNTTLALANRVQELEAAEQKRAVVALIDANSDRFTPTVRAWALTQPLGVVASFVKNAPRVDMRTAQPEPPTRGAGQGEGDSQVPTIPAEDALRLDRILGLGRKAETIGFAKGSNAGVVEFRTATPEQIKELQTKRRVVAS